MRTRPLALQMCTRSRDCTMLVHVDVAAIAVLTAEFPHGGHWCVHDTDQRATFSVSLATRVARAREGCMPVFHGSEGLRQDQQVVTCTMP